VQKVDFLTPPNLVEISSTDKEKKRQIHKHKFTNNKQYMRQICETVVSREVQRNTEKNNALREEEE
jgi:hypothetical protein